MFITIIIISHLTINIRYTVLKRGVFRSVYIVYLKKLTCQTGFYTKLNVWGSLGFNFDYGGGPISENGGPIFLYKHRILEGSTSFHEVSCQTSGHFHISPSQLDRNFRSFLGAGFLGDLD